MNAKLLATTALTIALLGGTAFAAAGTTTTAATMANPALMTTGITLTPTDAMASKLMGAPVYDGTAQNAQQIGTVKDLVLDHNGNIGAAIIGVGGFLGVGEKDVAVNYPALDWSKAVDGTNRLTLDTTKQALTAAPAFQYPVDNNAQAMNTAAPGATTTPALTAGTMGTGQDNASLTSNSGTPAANNAEVDPANLKMVAASTMKSDDLKGVDVISPVGVKLGSIGDFVLTKDGKVDAVIVDFGGFLGMGTKQVAMAYDNLKFVTDQNNKKYLEVNVSKDELNAQQAYNKDTYATDRAQQRMMVNS